MSFFFFFTATSTSSNGTTEELPPYIILTQNPHRRPPPKRDFSMYRTPSGKYYCASCNMTLNNETHFASHLEGKKHKAFVSAKKCGGGSNHKVDKNANINTDSNIGIAMVTDCETNNGAVVINGTSATSPPPQESTEEMVN